MHNESMQHSIGPPFLFSLEPNPQRTVGLRALNALIWGLLLGSSALGVSAQTSAEDSTPHRLRATSSGEAAVASSTPPPTASKPKLQGAVTGVVGWGPDYMGSKRYGWSLQPGLLLRYGRWSVSSNGSFAANTDDPNDLPRGLGLNLVGDGQDWVKLSLRVDSGRRSRGVEGLQGVDDVPRTLRLRLAARKELHAGVLGAWVITPGINLDLLGKGVGQTVDVSLGKDWNVSPQLKWSVSMGATWASRSYMRSYFGITPVEAGRSGYTEYDPSAGLRDLRVGLGLRYEINRRWVAVANASAQRLLGPAADSPLTQSAHQWGLGAGLGWRF